MPWGEYQPVRKPCPNARPPPFSLPRFDNNPQVKSLLEMNINSTVWMTRLALPGMVERKRGAIVNFGSAAALNPSALLAGYSGAKGFILVRERKREREAELTRL